MKGISAKRQFSQGKLQPLSTSEKAEIDRGRVDILILDEMLILTGVGEILKELGEAGDSSNEFEHAHVSSRSLWRLGEVVDRTMADVDRKLEQASERIQAAAASEKLGAAKRHAAPMPASAMVAEE